MEGDGGFPCPRSALDDQDAAEIRTDDAVLFGLDGRDDIRHAPGALGRQCGKKRALALQLGGSFVEQLRVEDLVLDANELSALRDQVSPGTGSHGRSGSRLVERACLRHAPVE